MWSQNVKEPVIKVFLYARRWVGSTNHKDISMLYFYVGFGSAWCGLILSLIIRTELTHVGTWLAGHGQVYNTVITAHAVMIIFFFLIPTLIGFFGNFLVPLHLHIPDIAFSRLNNFSFWVLPSSLFIVILVLTSRGGGVGTGWTMYPPLSLLENHSGKSVDHIIMALHISGLGSITGGLNFCTTGWCMRTEARRLDRIPLIPCTLMVVGFLLVASVPVLGGGLAIILTDRHLNTSFYYPFTGGDPVLFQHLFWFFGHPEVYILILPGMGLISVAAAHYAKKKQAFGHPAIIYSIISIGALGFVVWGHHIFTVGLDVDTRLFFSCATSVISIPTGIKVIGWITTLTGGGYYKAYRHGLWFTLGFLAIFTLGGCTGVILSNYILDTMLHDTYFVTGHFHYVLAIGAVFRVFSGFYLWFPVIFARQFSRLFGKLHFCFFFVAVNHAFMPHHFLGIAGIPRRYQDYPYYYGKFHYLSTKGAYAGLLASVIFIGCIYEAIRRRRGTAYLGRKNRLELMVPSRPLPAHTFHLQSTIYFRKDKYYNRSNFNWIAMVIFMRIMNVNLTQKQRWALYYYYKRTQELARERQEWYKRMYTFQRIKQDRHLGIQHKRSFFELKDNLSFNAIWTLRFWTPKWSKPWFGHAKNAEIWAKRGRRKLWYDNHPYIKIKILPLSMDPPKKTRMRKVLYPFNFFLFFSVWYFWKFKYEGHTLPLERDLRTFFHMLAYKIPPIRFFLVWYIACRYGEEPWNAKDRVFSWASPETYAYVKKNYKLMYPGVTKAFYWNDDFRRLKFMRIVDMPVPADKWKGYPGRGDDVKGWVDPTTNKKAYSTTFTHGTQYKFLNSYEDYDPRPVVDFSDFRNYFDYFLSLEWVPKIKENPWSDRIPDAILYEFIKTPEPPESEKPKKLKLADDPNKKLTQYWRAKFRPLTHDATPPGVARIRTDGW